MNVLRSFLKDIDLEELVNCILVQKDVRNAFLIQPADYDERDASSPKTAKLLASITKHFPELKQSIIGLDILISKQSYKSSDIKSNADIGHIIDYPCADDYDYILSHEDEPSTTIEILVRFVPGGDKDEVQIMVYRCRDDSMFKQAQEFAAKVKQVLSEDPRIGIILDDVVAEKNTDIPTKIIIEKIMNNSPLNKDEEFKMRNELWNIFSDGVSKQVAYFEYDFTNPVHKGIVLTLLTYCEHTPISAFYPLQLHKEQKIVKAINQQWALELVRILKSTKKPKYGGKHKTRKQRRV